jgi:hypothetical protein
LLKKNYEQRLLAFLKLKRAGALFQSVSKKTVFVKTHPRGRGFHVTESLSRVESGMVVTGQ